MLGLSVESRGGGGSDAGNLEHVAAGHFQPLPYTTFAASAAADAFRFMAQAKHIGKVVLSFAEECAHAAVPLERLIREDATYLITGGLTGLGLECAGWLAEQGAGSLILAGRRKPDQNARSRMAAMQAAGADVRAVALDVSDAAQLRDALAAIPPQMPRPG